MFVELGGLGEVALSITHHARRPLATAEPDDGATAWESALIAVTDDEVEHRLARAETFVIHESRLDGWSILDVLDEISGDLASYTELFDDDGEIAAEFVDSYGGGLIVADRVTVDPAHRGRGLGPLLLAHALRTSAPDANSPCAPRLNLSKFIDVAESARAGGVEWARLSSAVRSRGIEEPVYYAFHFTELLYPGCIAPTAMQALRPRDLGYLNRIGWADNVEFSWEGPFIRHLFDVDRPNQVPRSAAPSPLAR